MKEGEEKVQGVRYYADGVKPLIPDANLLESNILPVLPS